MTDRNEGRRGSRGNERRPTRSSKPRAGAGRKARDGGSDEKEGPAAGRKGTEGPASKRAGRRPPKAQRDRKEGATGSTRASTTRKAPDREPVDRTVRSGRGVRKAYDRPYGRDKRKERNAEPETSSDGRVRLNRYLAQSGICSRREADDLITAGVVTVNGNIVTELGTKILPTDTVHYGGQRLSMEKKRYVLLNKPKGFITTTDDPRDRRTVMALVEAACTERLYPVGRLDRHTTGVLLMTNDGDLAKKLTHPSHGAEKIYHVTLDRPATKGDLAKLVDGVMLDDGEAKADEASYVEGATKREVGVKLHVGRNRIVRRMFEALGHEVVKLDRVIFAGLTKKDISRGKWRHLSDKEVLFLSRRK